MPGNAALRTVAGLALGWALAWAPAGCASAGEVEGAISLAADDLVVGGALAALTDLAEADHELDQSTLPADTLMRPAALTLVDATAATARQALAHALGAEWWHDGARIRFGRGGRPSGTPAVRLHPSSLQDDVGAELLVRQVLAPWLDVPGAGLAYLAEEGRWYATLPPRGHERLIEVLALIEHGVAQCPSLLADADAPDPRRALAHGVDARGWRAFARRVADAARISVAVAPALADGNADLALPAGTTLAELPARVAALGARCAFVRGALCLDVVAPIDREGAWQRVRPALIPIGHLARTAGDGELLAATIAVKVRPQAWTRAGYALAHRPAQSALVVVADDDALGAVLDALSRIDLLGLDDGLASLGAGAP
ncbi:MAG TPA: hypothetical protein VEL07_01075 [Planctomycetota bacterium]|nr:hypothetical protein [Planctomycetota bacterium]